MSRRLAAAEEKTRVVMTRTFNFVVGTMLVVEGLKALQDARGEAPNASPKKAKRARSGRKAKASAIKAKASAIKAMASTSSAKASPHPRAELYRQKLAVIEVREDDEGCEKSETEASKDAESNAKPARAALVDDEALALIMSHVSLALLDNRTVMGLIQVALVKRKLHDDIARHRNRASKNRAIPAIIDPSSPRISDAERAITAHLAQPLEIYHEHFVSAEYALASRHGIAKLCAMLSRSCNPYLLYKQVAMTAPHVEGRIRIYTRHHILNHAVFIITRLATMCDSHDVHLVMHADRICKKYAAKS